ncbi:hypothetical protein CAP39_04590 [Sphingomonas sp. IBVSS1]|uniref:17 kDa surface antigen n=1 Tax=Sandarakinorhabdus cyanobacteriorum TaxID=1981098 RepID=A0A255Y8X9_9SPHN|nr:hypothetical protein [Sandarakinorhabdus cyanobacteriorum]OSZ72604.1 hypothetical protein CAP39_04590 [Sphingomonas sp. IBVSS1]OYQ25689.1 hypothetical protein CHU93_13240 [Sandarakinorhabdus cyanobacteriorum]
MRHLISLAAALAIAGPAAAQTRPAPTSPVPQMYETGGKTYATLEECQRAKKRAKTRATIAGAVIAGAGAAALGGNLGETALVAGAGALAGREIAKATSKNKQC